MSPEFIMICGITLLSSVALYRAALGPTVADRLVAVNLFTNQAVLLIILLAILSNDFYFLDVSLVFVLCSFVAVVAIVKGLIRGKLS